MYTVFDNVATKENDHTNLLRNIMERNSRVAKVVLTYLIERELSDIEAASLEFCTQQLIHGTHGREIPDIVIDGKNFRCVIEAKVDPALELTEAQRQGYPGCFSSKGENHLSFLAPSEWKFRTEAKQIQVLRPNCVSIHIRDWRGLITKLHEIATSLNDDVLNEVVAFWKWRFEMEQLTLPERKALNVWPDEKYRAVRKLEKTVRVAEGIFDADGVETQLETDTESYGFYVKRAHSYVLWIGIWAKSPFPLSFCLQPTGAKWVPLSSTPTNPVSVEGYHVWPLAPETWDCPEKIYEIVKPLIAAS